MHPDDPKASATTTALPGRFVVSARGAHIVADTPAARGGPGEAPSAAELMLSSLAVCGLSIVTRTARERGDALAGATIEATYALAPGDRTRIERLGLVLRACGVDQGAADALLRAFTEACPIWNTVVRAGVDARARAEAVGAATTVAAATSSPAAVAA